MRQKRKTYKILPGRPEGKSPFVGPMHILEDSSKLDLRETAHDDVDKMSFGSGREPFAGSCESDNELSCSTTGEELLG
jgi:hypothetical protein